MENKYNFTVNRIKDLSFSIKEHLFNETQNREVRFQLGQTLAHNQEHDLINLTVRAVYYFADSTPENFVAEIYVQNVFEVADLKSMTINGRLHCPENLLVKLVGLSLTHTRALFAKNLWGTPLQDVYLPISDSREVAMRFFENLINKGIGGIEESKVTIQPAIKTKKTRKKKEST